jgi:hypothetical protein
MSKLMVKFEKANQKKKYQRENKEEKAKTNQK